VWYSENGSIKRKLRTPGKKGINEIVYKWFGKSDMDRESYSGEKVTKKFGSLIQLRSVSRVAVKFLIHIKHRIQKVSGKAADACK
jgi:hypothetical protein